MGLINLIDGVKPDSAAGGDGDGDGDGLQMPEEMPRTFCRQAVFLSCLWTIWLAFIVSTMGQAPKKVLVPGRRASTLPMRRLAPTFILSAYGVLFIVTRQVEGFCHRRYRNN